ILGNDQITESARPLSPAPDTLDFSGMDAYIVVALGMSRRQLISENLFSQKLLSLQLQDADRPPVTDPFDTSDNNTIENVSATRYDDLIHGNNLNNRLDGREGNDTLAGYSGQDILIGGKGSDKLYGGDQDDQLYGLFPGANQLDATNPGKDFLDGGAG